MPVINIEYDDVKLSEDEVKSLSEATQRVVSEVTGIEDVFVYANTAKVKVKIAPIEIFVQMSGHKIENLDDLTSKIKDKLASWKIESGFKTPINLTVIPMNWKIEIGI